jgi:hypothetical protein
MTLEREGGRYAPAGARTPGFADWPLTLVKVKRRERGELVKRR